MLNLQQKNCDQIFLAEKLNEKRYAIIAGAPKSGTSSIFDNFSNHPNICPSSVKETYYFLDDNVSPLFNKKSNFSYQGIAGYEDYFKHCNNNNLKNVYLEATADYIYHITAIRGLSSIRPQPKIIFVLRNPSHRAYSVFQFAKNNLSVIDKHLTFENFIEKIRNKNGFNTSYSNVLMNTLEYGKYIQYLDLWLEYFEPENLCVLTFEDYMKDNILFMKKISRFIGISEDFWNDYNFSKTNLSYKVKCQFLQRIYIKIASKKLFNSRIKNILKRVYFALNIQKLPEKTVQDSSELKKLDEYYSLYNKKLEEKFSIDLSVWK